MSKWHFPDELVPPTKWNLLISLNSGLLRVCRRLGEHEVYELVEVDNRNRLLETKYKPEDIFAWTTCPYAPHGKTPVTKFGEAKLKKKMENRAKWEALKKKAEEDKDK